MSVHILRQECRSQAQFCFDCFSIKRIVVDVLIFLLSFFNLKPDCLLNFTLLFTKYIINFWCFAWNWSSVYGLSLPTRWVHLHEYWRFRLSLNIQGDHHNGDSHVVSQRYTVHLRDFSALVSNYKGGFFVKGWAPFPELLLCCDAKHTRWFLSTLRVTVKWSQF